ncbi:hypothetical protein HAN_2g195 (nucleomorph) [Hemiselmis andersenii]|uniref:GTF3C1 extended winged-helix domain-containing protein n=3 Tax=Hemiselmis andersenii TaxID=464988 RepID=A9BKL8_HEMAN|nr:hypothetical protein HAN_2g195 [Hemiselmis andersenii]ABW98023.1 hypothetical protein HAN_2g195 [Hemiselmis andersenii]
MDLLELFLNGKKGTSLKKILENFSMNIDLKKAFKIIEFFKKNVFFFGFFINKKKNNFFFFNRWEFKRMEILKNSIGKNFFFTEISNQILREIGKKREGIFQYLLAKKLNLKSNYIHHVLGKLISLYLIKKYICILKINSKISNIILLKPNLNFFWFQECQYRYTKEKNLDETKEKMKIFFIIKTLSRKLKNIWTEKDIKYGVAYLNKIPKKINKRRIHRKWQKIRKKCKKSGLFIFKNNFRNQFEKTIKTSRKILEYEIKEIPHTPKPNQIKSNEMKVLFSFSLSTLIQKNFLILNNVPISCCKFLEKFKGYFSYQNIYCVLALFNKYKGINKTLEQMGRQKILHFKRKLAKLPTSSNDLVISEKILRIKKGITEQTLQRKLILLSFIKHNFISLKEIGQIIALKEKKGLKKIDSKVIRRFLSDLIKLNLLKVIKIQIQISFKKFRKFEFVINPDLEKNQIEMIFKFLSISVPKSIKNQRTMQARYNLFIELAKKKKKNFFLIFYFKKIFKPFFKKKTKFFIFFFKKTFFEINSKRLLFLQKINREFSPKKSIFFFFKIFLKKLKIFKLQNKNLLLRKFSWFIKEKNLKKPKKFIFTKKKGTINLTKKAPCNFILNFQKFSFFQKFSKTNQSLWDSFYQILFFKKKLKIAKPQNFMKKNFFSGKRWDCDMDIRLFSKFLNIKINSDSNQINDFFKIKIIKRRFKTISSCTNLKFLNFFFKKAFYFLISSFLDLNSSKFYFHVKRALEFHSFIYGFNFQFFLGFFLKKFFISFSLIRKQPKIEIKKNQAQIEKILNQNFLFFFFGLNKKTNLIKILNRNFFFGNIFSIFLKEKNNKNDFKTWKEKNFDLDNILNFSFLKKNKIPKNKIPQKNIYPCERIFSSEKIKENFFLMNFDQNSLIFIPFFLKCFPFEANFENSYSMRFFENKKKFIFRKKTNVGRFLEVRVFSFLSNFSPNEKNIKFFNIWTKKSLKKTFLLSEKFFKTKIKNFLKNKSKTKIFLDFLFNCSARKKNKSFFFFNNLNWLENFSEDKFFPNSFIFFRVNKKELKERKICRLKLFKKIEYFILTKIIKNPAMDFQRIIHSHGNYFFSKKLFYQILEIILLDDKIQKQFFTLKFNGYSLTSFQFFSEEKNLIKKKILQLPFFYPLLF